MRRVGLQARLMIRCSSHTRLRRVGSLACAALAIAATLMACQCLAQDAKPAPPADAGAPPESESSGSFRPGLFEALGRLMKDSAAKLDAQFNHAHDALGEIGNQTGDAAKGAVDNAKSAADAIIGLPNTHIVKSHEACVAAANGAPDCRAAADTMCRGKGFASGKVLDTQTTQKCPAWVWLSGRPPPDGACSRETFVTQAACQ